MFQQELLGLLTPEAVAAVVIPQLMMLALAVPVLSFLRSTSHENLSTHGH
jgi:hypothetical protein